MVCKCDGRHGSVYIEIYFVLLLFSLSTSWLIYFWLKPSGSTTVDRKVNVIREGRVRGERESIVGSNGRCCVASKRLSPFPLPSLHSYLLSHFAQCCDSPLYYELLGFVNYSLTFQIRFLVFIRTRRIIFKKNVNNIFVHLASVGIEEANTDISKYA